MLTLSSLVFFYLFPYRVLAILLLVLKVFHHVFTALSHLASIQESIRAFLHMLKRGTSNKEGNEAKMGEVVTLSTLALALGMDAFSASLGIGMAPIRLKRIFYIGIIIGSFHIILPLLGIIAGRFVTDTFGTIASLIGGLLLIIAGTQMIVAFFNKKRKKGRFLSVGD